MQFLHCRKQESFSSKAPVVIERPLHGKFVRVTTIPEFDNDVNIYRFLEIFEDISLQKQHEETFRAISTSAQDAVVMMDSNGSVSFWNSSAERIFGYTEKEILGKYLHRLVTPPGMYEKFKEGFEFFKSTGEGNAIGKTVGLSAIKKDGTGIPVEISLSSVMLKGKRNAIGIIRDISERKVLQNMVELNLHKMKRLFNGTVDALSTMAESKDPYTAGHQRRVAQLTCAIARAMMLGEDEVEGLYVASILHDIGKVYVPSELLSKPGRLNEIELSLIKTHSEVGYNILKNIESDWMTADIVHQHHERLDGSGYPGGLKGDEILLGARIIAVADVVEAISSHRPYRAALGTDIAMAEITSRKGTHYDADVVDTCVELFNNGFAFSLSTDKIC
ncbi:MAG: PAS domain S-box protein [Nitrospirae bacterium]|nr:PAS domain S-box protein [Nitrospirota bacterium]